MLLSMSMINDDDDVLQKDVHDDIPDNVMLFPLLISLFCQELTSDPSLPEKQQVILAEQETSIRLALAKNLALALIKE